jgi:hypothetical protein
MLRLEIAPDKTAFAASLQKAKPAFCQAAKWRKFILRFLPLAKQRTQRKKNIW